MQCHNFNKDWTFEKADQADRLKAFYGNSNAVVVTLPHDAMIREKRDKDCPSGAQSGFYPGGVYTYEKKFMAQNEWKKQDVFLEFEGIYGIARVWINGSLAAVNRNGYMGFSVDLKPWISYEHENIIRIDVDNSKQPNSRWYSGSGIYRDVNLWTGKDVYISHDKLRITTLSVNDDMAVIEVCAQLKNIIGHGLEAEWYRCKRLKEAGFNAIRSAHHPMSRAMLDACDHIGMLVMDELTDMWDKEKNTYDFSDIFEDEYNQWINHMVEKDYNHPSVVIYSVGNEIQEAGTKQGAWINRILCNKFHELDNTRYTTNALNGLNCAGRRLSVIMRDVAEKFGMDSHGSGSGGGSNALNSFMSLMSGEKGEVFAKHPLVSEALEECSQSCDITGLNYLSGRYELEHELHPAKTVLGTETYPADIENLWKLVEAYPHVIGDFTWTGYDYIGEAGVGIFHYDGNANFTSIYPERLGYIGDIDLIGNRRPISYFREIVYGLTDKPYIAVERLEHAGQTACKTAWMFKDNISSWTWKGFEGTTANVDVYSSGDEVELFLNDKSLGRKPAGIANHFTASYEVPYEPGTLKAVAYQKNRKLGEYELSTAKSVTKLKVCRVTENERNIAYIKLWLVDDNGIINLQEAEKRLLHASVAGNGVLEGFGTANPSSEEDYFSDSVTTFDGSALAAVRWKDAESKEPAVLKVWTDDGCQVMINIENN